MHPEFGIATLQLPEEGSVLAKSAGRYALSFRNTSSLLFAIKLDIAIAVR